MKLKLDELVDMFDEIQNYEYIVYDKNQPIEYLTETSVQYSVYPQTIEIGYVNEWLAQFLGVPSVEKYETDLSKVLTYFNNLTKNKDIIGDHSTAKLLFIAPPPAQLYGVLSIFIKVLILFVASVCAVKTYCPYSVMVG